MKAIRSARYFIVLSLLAALSFFAVVGGSLSAAPLTAHGSTGQALALGAALRALKPLASAKSFKQAGIPQNLHRAPDGRFVYSRADLMRPGAMRAGALLSPRAAGSPLVNEAVQTFDVFNPPPAFAPTQGPNLTPTNLTPVWTQDETMIVFSSNRTAAGTAGTRFHIWAVPINGGTPIQLTDSTAASGEEASLPHGEFFPALSANQQLAFTSDALSANVQNLFVAPFQATTVAVSALPASPTLRGNDTAGNPVTGFTGVGRPTFSPTNPDQIVFAAHSVTGTNAGHSHLYFLYVSTQGFSSSLPSLPAKITDGPSDDTDPAYSQDGLLIAFSSTATAIASTNSAASPDPNVSLVGTSAPGTSGSIFVIGGGGAFGFGTVPNGGKPVTAAGTDNFAPAWSSVQRNAYLNPNTGQEYLAFARGTGPAATHDIYYVQILANTGAGTEQLLTETAANPAVKLNTDDPSGTFNNIYPSWSPFSSVFSITYSSNRSVTYTNPSTNTATETAISIPQGGSLGGAATVGAQYRGILESQVLNLDPPSLLPYSGNEIVHVADGSGAATRYGITPGQPVTFTVRLSSREAGVDDNNVYLQIKNPNSKYQDAQGLEHKVFAKDFRYFSQTNNTSLPDSGSSGLLINGGGYFGSSGYPGLNRFTDSNGVPFFVGNRGSVAGVEGPESFLSGTAVASDTAPQTDTNIGTISIGRSGGGTNPASVTTATGGAVTDPDTKAVVLHPPGSDPALFIPWGPEYECQVVNPQFAATSGTGDTAASDFRNPFYLAGVDDQQSFSGAGTQRPTSATGTVGGGDFVPAEWLKLTRLPAAQQDGQGGFLYNVVWTTPATGSDYYMDVIAYDKAVPPAGYAGGNGGENWRIYDNVWGFSTAATIGNNDILVVSDYALGQKFAATTFGGQRGLLNLVPKLYGTESYVTDVDVNVLPNAIYRHQVITGADVNNPSREVLNQDEYYAPTGRSIGTSSLPHPFLNGLGVGSYNDIFIDDQSRVDGQPAVRSQAYSIWRILSRGPVPASVYQNYEPRIVTQPAVADTAASVSIAAGQTAVAKRCILWLSPYTGDVLAGAGTLTDAATQSQLRAFVAAGGRLCISGQDVGSALTQGGTVNNGTGGFLPDVLNAKLASPNAGTHLPAPGAVATDNRITFSPSYDNNLVGNFEEQVTGLYDVRIAVSLRDRLIRISNNYGGNYFASVYLVDLRNLANWRTDGALDQLGPYIQPFSLSSPSLFSNTVVGQIDTITPGTGAHTDLTLAPFTNQILPVQGGNDAAASSPGGVGLIYTENPLSSNGSGSKVVYATFGLEALSAEYYRRTISIKPNPDIYKVRNVRQGILHNIVSYLRTGTITGTVRSTSGNGVGGAGIGGVTVYLQSGLGPAIPGRGTFSATTDSSGGFIIDGVEPGSYTLAAYKTGYLRATSNPGLLLVVEGDTTQQASLTLVPAPPGTITGKVTDAANTAIPDASVIFTSSAGQPYRTTTDANGNYTLSSIPPDTYTGVASKAGFGTATQTATLTSSATLTVNFTLVPGPGSATGRVIDSNGQPISGATVFFSSGSPATVVAHPTTDATGTYTIASLPAGTYNVTATATGFGSSAPIQVVISGGQQTTVPDIQLGAVANGTLGGLVTSAGGTAPLAGVTLTITNTGTGLAVTPSPVTVATATTAPDGSRINYGPITLGQGTYSVMATSSSGAVTAAQTVTISANTFSRLDFTGINGVPALHTFQAGLNFVSLPFDYSTSSFDALFGVLNTAATGTTPNGNRSHVAVWNPLAGQYALDPTAPADVPRLGVGYWVFLKSAAALTVAGSPAPSGTVGVSLHPSWNQIGVPSTSGVLVSSLTFTSGTTTLSFADASSGANHVVSPTLYRYDGANYQTVSASETLQPYSAYWIKVYVDTTVHIPTGR